MRLAIMRPADKLAESEALARAHGFDPLCASPLRVEKNDSVEVDGFLEKLDKGEVDMTVLTSSTGVECLMSIVSSRGIQESAIAQLNATELVAIGPITAKSMEDRGISARRVPKVHSSEGLLAELAGERLDGMRITLLRSDHGEPALKEGLASLGAVVDDVAIYRLVPSMDTPELRVLIGESLSDGVDAFAFTSSLSARTFIEAAERFSPGRIKEVLNTRTVAAMGEPTKRKLEEMGIRVGVVPAKATFEDMLLAIEQTIRSV